MKNTVSEDLKDRGSLSFSTNERGFSHLEAKLLKMANEVEKRSVDIEKVM